MHPQDIIGPQQFFEMSGEILIHPEITAKVAARKFGEVEPLMQDGPQHTVCETVVELLGVVLAQIDGGVSGVVVDNGLDCWYQTVCNASAPAKPEATVPLERGSDRHFEPAGPRAAIRNTNSVRHYDEPRQYRSPQLRDSLIAVNINPDIEYVWENSPTIFRSLGVRPLTG